MVPSAGTTDWLQHSWQTNRYSDGRVLHGNRHPRAATVRAAVSGLGSPISPCYAARLLGSTRGTTGRSTEIPHFTTHLQQLSWLPSDDSPPNRGTCGKPPSPL